MQTTTDSRSLFCLTGVAVRIAQMIGLNTDGSTYAIPPFDAEMRRRLWWQLTLIDSRIAEISGSGTSMLAQNWNTKLPANVNDSDLFPGMKDPPMERPGLTEMIAVRLRYEISQFVRQQSQAIRGSAVIEEGKIWDFEQRLKREYLNYCDPSIPLHLVSFMMTNGALCKFRMRLRHPHFTSNQTKDFLPAERDNMFQLA